MRRSCLAAVLALCISLPAASQEPLVVLLAAPQVRHQQASADSSHQAAEHNQNQSSAAPVQGDTGEGDTKTADRPSQVGADWWMVRLTGVLAFVAVLQLVAFIVQAIALRKTVKQMEAEERRRLRAYVFVENANISPPQWGGDGTPSTPIGSQHEWPTCKLTIKNSGQTPAYNLRFWASMVVRELPLGGDIPQAPDPDPRLGPSVALAPGGTLAKRNRPDRPFTDAETKAIRLAESAIYVFGAIVYRDAFRKMRRTNFLYWHSPTSDVDGRAHVYHEGNEAD